MTSAICIECFARTARSAASPMIAAFPSSGAGALRFVRSHSAKSRRGLDVGDVVQLIGLGFLRTAPARRSRSRVAITPGVMAKVKQTLGYRHSRYASQDLVASDRAAAGSEARRNALVAGRSWYRTRSDTQYCGDCGGRHRRGAGSRATSAESRTRANQQNVRQPPRAEPPFEYRIRDCIHPRQRMASGRRSRSCVAARGAGRQHCSRWPVQGFHFVGAADIVHRLTRSRRHRGPRCRHA